MIEGVKYMAKYNEHKCFTCGRIFDYCGRCVITPVIYKAEGFCSEKCSHVFNILTKHGSNLITADEASKALSECNIDEMTLVENLIAHIDRINSEASVKVEETVVTTDTAEIAEDETTVKQTNKDNKKKR